MPVPEMAVQPYRHAVECLLDHLEETRDRTRSPGSRVTSGIAAMPRPPADVTIEADASSVT
jgi:hypothetical protein